MASRFGGSGSFAIELDFRGEPGDFLRRMARREPCEWLYSLFVPEDEILVRGREPRLHGQRMCVASDVREHLLDASNELPPGELKLRKAPASPDLDAVECPVCKTLAKSTRRLHVQHLRGLLEGEA